MQDLNNYYDDYFEPIEVAEGVFVEGVDRHIAKLENHNPGGIYDQNVTDTKAKQEVLKSIISARDSEGTEQLGSTIVMDAAKAAFIKFAQIREGALKSTFEGTDAAQYKEFLPGGLTEIDNSTLANIETIMDRWVTKATLYETELGTPFKTDCIAKRTSFLTARAAQLTNIGQVSDLTSAVKAALKQMALQLTTNVRDTAKNNTGVENAANLFFDQQFFQRPNATGIYEGENVSGQTKTSRSKGWSTGMSVKITNKGVSAFLVCFANAQGVACVDNTSMASGESKVFIIDDLGWSIVNHFLNITAITGGSGAIWKVEIM